jgi:hypothetical protein
MLMLSDRIDHKQTKSGIERRRGLRIEQDRPIKVFEPAGSRYFGGKTQDISSTGLRIELPSHAMVREGETLAVHVGLSDRGHSLANRRQMLRTRVVWVDRSTNNPAGKMQVGVEFLASIVASLDAA